MTGILFPDPCGKNGKKFKLYKFRSMYTDAEERKAQLAAENRVTDGLMFKLDFDPHHRLQTAAGWNGEERNRELYP